MYKATLISLVGLAAASAVPSSTPDCWSTCFAQNGVTSESSLCGNTAVDQCIHETCSKALEEKYCSWYDDYCGASPASSSSAPVPSSSTPVSPVSSAPPSSTPTCWTNCFEEAGIKSESDLCGNTEVDKCIQDNCSGAEDKAYWAWYESYCPAPSSSAPVSPASSSAPVWSASSSAPASPSQTPSCWGKCFSEAGIESESELCGNTEVDKCIHDTCSSAEDKKYWEWYESYCPAPSSSAPVSPASSSAPVSPSSPSQTPGCWAKCFAENDITSESALCGNTAVDQCIHDTCSAAEDKAYWDWYNGYCAPVTSVVTITSTVSCSTGAYPTTYTSAAPVSPEGYPSSPVAPAAPPYSSPAAAAGTGYAQPSNGWASPSASGFPVAATGAGVINKPSALLAAVLAIAAFF